ncbi:MAG TPA: DUF2271 domain-containing protein [Polyangiaceae bacterium]|nr:DUF2271 domain-containing protein [Polyangiaceae bacterium]
MHRFEPVAVTVLLFACGPVAKSDPDFWDPSADIGGKLVDFGNPGGGAPPVGGAPSYGGEGQPPPPPGSGGWGNPGSGGQPNYGGENSGSGGYQNPGSGGYQQSGGGVQNQGGSDPGAGGAVQQTPNGDTCTFTFTVTTVTANGRFAPRNVGALWIENQSGQFVKSLEVWGAQRLGNLTAWTSVGGNTVDAVTSATLSRHRQHTDTWDCTDSTPSRQTVPNGSYQACVSFAEDDAIPFFGPPPHVACAPFQRGAGPFTTNPPDQTNFVGWTLQMQ